MKKKYASKRSTRIKSVPYRRTGATISELKWPYGIPSIQHEATPAQTQPSPDEPAPPLLLLAEAAIKRRHLEDRAVNGDKLAPEHLLAEVVTGQKLAPGAVDGSRLSSGAVGQEHILDAVITESMLQNGSVTSEKLAMASVQGHHIAAGSITGDKIKAESIDGMHVMRETLSGYHLIPGTIEELHLERGLLDKLAYQIEHKKLRKYRITENMLEDAAVTEAKLAAGSVMTEKLADECVTGDKLASQAVQARHIADKTIGASKLSICPVESVKESTLQQFGLQPFFFRIEDETLETTILFDKPFANSQYVLVATTNDPACYAAVKLKDADAAVVRIVRTKCSTETQGILNWIAVGTSLQHSNRQPSRRSSQRKNPAVKESPAKYPVPDGIQGNSTADS
jgi:hypothetical protein